MASREERTPHSSFEFVIRPFDALSEGQMELRAASMYSGGYQDEVDYIAWNPTHPDLFCTSGMKDRKIVFFDTRRKSTAQLLTLRSIDDEPSQRVDMCSHCS